MDPIAVPHPADSPAPPAAGRAAPLGRELALLARGPEAAISPELLAAYAAAAAPNSLRAFRADITAFDTWCRNRGAPTVPARAEAVAQYLAARAGEGAAPASLARARASIAKLHKLCRLADPTQDELVTLTLAAHRRERGVAQKQAYEAIVEINHSRPSQKSFGTLIQKVCLSIGKGTEQGSCHMIEFSSQSSVKN